MSEKIQLRRSAVSGRVPTTSQLDLGEIGINTHDGKLYIKKDDGTASIVEIGAGITDLQEEVDNLPVTNSTTYLYTTSTGNTASASTLGFNNSNWSSATYIYASLYNSQGKSVKAAAQEHLKKGAIVVVQNMSSSNGENYLRAKVKSVSITSTTVRVHVDSVSTEGSTPTLLDNLTFGVVSTSNSFVIEEALGFDVDDGTGVGAFTTSELTDNVTLKSALETLGSKAKLLREGLGVSVGDTDLGTFAGSTIDDNQTVKGALRDLEIGLEAGAISVNASRYKFSTSVGTGPGTGKLRYDSTSTNNIDRIYLHDTDRDGRDLKPFYDFMLKKGVYVYVASPDTDDTLLARMSGDATYSTDYYTIDLEAIQISGNVPAADQALTFGLAIGPSISGTGQLSVANNTVPTYSDNTSAKSGGLVDGDIYRTSGGNLKIVYS